VNDLSKTSNRKETKKNKKKNKRIFSSGFLFESLGFVSPFV